MEKVRLISQTDPKSPIAEAFRTLRTNIQFTNIDKDIRIIVVTSSQPREGKSTVATNLAFSLGQEEKKVLLIDGDMRKPTIHKPFRISNLYGLTNIIIGNRVLEEVLYSSEASNSSLFILPTGPIPPNPAELINSKRMRTFLKEAKSKFDILVIDAPPVGLFTDAAILSTFADGVIFVSAVGETNTDVSIRAKGLLDNVKANILGVVLNKVPLDRDKKARYGYYGYGSYRSETVDRRKPKRGRR